MFGCTNSYLDMCPSLTASPFLVQGNSTSGTLILPGVGAAAGAECLWINHGDSGGAWIIGVNGFPHGIGALNQSIGSAGLQGAYLGSEARALWSTVQAR